MRQEELESREREILTRAVYVQALYIRFNKMASYKGVKSIMHQ